MYSFSPLDTVYLTDWRLNCPRLACVPMHFDLTFVCETDKWSYQGKVCLPLSLSLCVFKISPFSIAYQCLRWDGVLPAKVKIVQMQKLVRHALL